jgi:hypothetical protein
MKPEPPKSVYSRFGGNPIPVTPTEEVRYDADIGAWVCNYETEDGRVPPEFREWVAVWNANERTWEVDDVA